MSSRTAPLPQPPIRTLLSRAARLRCPQCGEGGVFRSWFRMSVQCTQCGLRFERGEPGYQVGSYMFNLIAAELVFASVFIAVVVGSWPDPPWTLLTWGGAAMMVGLPLLFFPFSRTIFLAFDLVFRPRDYDSPRDPEI